MPLFNNGLSRRPMGAHAQTRKPCCCSCCCDEAGEPEPVQKSYYVEFDGDSSYINCGRDASINDLPIHTWTLDMWWRKVANGVDPTAFVISKQESGEAAVGWYVQAPPTGIIVSAIMDTSAFTNTIEDPVLGQWQHLAIVFNTDGDGCIYVAMDGVWCAYNVQIAGSGSYYSDAGIDLTIASGNGFGPNPFMQMDVQWLRISSGARFPVGVPFTPPDRCAPPAVDGTTLELWAMDEGAGAVTAASVVPANQGAMTDCVWQECV